MDHLVVILDLNPAVWSLRGLDEFTSSSSSVAKSESSESSQPFTPSAQPSHASFNTVLSHLQFFLHTFLLLSRQNRLTFLVTHPFGSNFLYPLASTEESTQLESNNAPFMDLSAFSDTLRRGIIATLKEYRNAMNSSVASDAASSSSPASPSPAAALSRTSLLSSALSIALCHLNRDVSRSGAPKVRQRVLLVSVSHDTPSQYIPLMNCIFSAQKAQIPLDSLVLADTDSLVLQQASYLSKGIYARIGSHSTNFEEKSSSDSLVKLETKALKSSLPTPLTPPTDFSPSRSLLQYLLHLYLPDSSLRQHLILPMQQSIDFRATCFCHKEPKDSVYVCPVCLAIFCKRAVKCAVCSTRFSMELNPISGPIGVGQPVAKKSEEKKDG